MQRVTSKAFRWVILILLIVLSRGYVSAGEGSSRPEHWAAAIQQTGLPNLYQVSPVLYRGAQPTKAGFIQLKQMGIKTVINLRKSKKDARLMAGLNFNYYHIGINAFSPKKKDFSRFLEIVSNPENHPVFVHCKHGADRTGAAVALYRIVIQKWEVNEALNEMVNGGFHFHRFHLHLKTFIRNFIKDLP